VTRRWLIIVVVMLGVGVLAPSAIAAEPASTVGFSMSPEPVGGQPVSIAVSGTSSQAGELAVYMLDSSPVAPLWARCPSVQRKEEVVLSNLAPPTPVAAGSYSQTYSFTPNYAGTYVVCGYLYDPSTEAIYAAGTGSFTSITAAAKAEAEKRVAEAKATEEKSAKEKSEVEALAREAAARAAANARAAAELAAAKTQAHKTPVKHLSVEAVSHSRHSSADPGYTDLDITTSPYAYVVVKLSRYGHTTEHLEWGGRSSEVAEIVRWSCKSPGGTYRYVVTARSNVGRTLIRRGHFAPVSVARCHALKRQEAEARERSEHEAAEERSSVEREERERLDRNEANCRAEGGTPRTLYVEGRAERYCIASWGGFLPVPH
jgi:hypothetical protein